MPDHEPRLDLERMTQGMADRLYLMVMKKRVIEKLTDGLVSPRQRLQWSRRYMEHQIEQEALEVNIAEKILVAPWTIHIAGAPGMDEESRCDDQEECENPWCGMVQKCSRCLDILVNGFSVGFEEAEMMNEALTGRTLQEQLTEVYEANPIDSDGPTWVPVNTEVAKHPVTFGDEARSMVIINPDKKILTERGCLLLPCEAIDVDEIVAQMDVEPGI